MASNVTALVKSYITPVDVSDAVTYLEGLMTSFSKLYLYQKFFPAEYQASTGRKLPREGEVYSDRELEFFKLVHERLFPVEEVEFEDDPYYEQAGAEGRRNEIAIINMGIEGWWDTPISDWRGGWQIMIVLKVGSSEYLAEIDLENEELNCEVLNFQLGTLDWVQFKWLLEGTPEPLCYFDQAIEVIDHSTGNPFFDYSSEVPCDLYSWNERDILELTDLYAEAKQIDEHVETFLKWLVASVENLREVIRIWNECIV